MSEYALWQRLDTSGHDAVYLTRSDTGWTMRGTTVFKHAAGPACIDYVVELDASWKTVSGQVSGRLGERAVEHRIERRAEGWYLDGRLVEGLGHLWDLDFAFTPATNLQQLRRMALATGQEIELPVAWFDLDTETLSELPQRYERCTESTYWYVAPTVPYKGFLEIADNGFVRRYPDVWGLVD
jgi:hypothetical protein